MLRHAGKQHGRVFNEASKDWLDPMDIITSEENMNILEWVSAFQTDNQYQLVGHEINLMIQ